MVWKEVSPNGSITYYPQPPAGREVDHDPVDHPSHYTSHPAGIECIDVIEHMTLNIGNAIKYLWRTGLKAETSRIEDLRKAAWYVNREIERLTRKSQ